MSINIPKSVYKPAKHVTMAYEQRKRYFEQLAGLKPDEAREKVLILAENVSDCLDQLSENIETGRLDSMEIHELTLRVKQDDAEAESEQEV